MRSTPQAPAKVTFLPTPGRVVVKLDTRDRIGSLFLPRQSQESRSLGKIIAIGSDEEEGDFYDLKIGDLVMFGQHAGVRVTVEGESALILGTREIVCRVVFSDGEGERPDVRFEHQEGDPAEFKEIPIDENAAEYIPAEEI